MTPVFSITLHKKDQVILEGIKNYLGVGKIYKNSPTKVKYDVTSIEEFKLLIKHFDSFSLKTKKHVDYLL